MASEGTREKRLVRGRRGANAGTPPARSLRRAPLHGTTVRTRKARFPHRAESAPQELRLMLRVPRSPAENFRRTPLKVAVPAAAHEPHNPKKRFSCKKTFRPFVPALSAPPSAHGTASPCRFRHEARFGSARGPVQRRGPACTEEKRPFFRSRRAFLQPQRRLSASVRLS